MNYFKKLYEEIKTKPNSNKIMEDVICTIDEFLDDFKEAHPDKYIMLKNKLYISVNGYHFNKEMLEEAVNNMVNDDGTKGGKWTVNETNSVANSNSVSMKNFNEYDWNYVMNMVHSDYCEVLGDNTTSYIKLAHKFLNDKDAPDGKALRYYMCMKEKY